MNSTKLERDALTDQVVASLIAKFNAAFEAEDLPGMEAVVDTALGSPNGPFKRELLRQLEC